LSALMATICEADLLIMLTDVDGLYDRDPSDPEAKHIPLVRKVTDEMIAAVGEKGSALASGGMLTKLEAACIAGEYGIPSVIINGERPEILYDLFEGKAKCTLFNLK
ncbi:MAG: glutamate 5-kinase, partial [Ruminiclostridium sp.]|nr:glutamate 5-kinase [Ruminiclostridium sp.]